MRIKGLAIVMAVLFSPAWAVGETLLELPDGLPDYQKDRGEGVPLSMFATYIEKGQFIFYPFFEYYRDSDMEYAPEELGYGLDQDFRGKYRANEGLLFFGYGLTDDLALELEAAVISAELETASEDPTAVPDKIEESGLGDVEGQVRWRFLREKERRPELFTYFEYVFPTQKDKVLIGTQDWEFKLGAGIAKGFRFGTMTARLAVEYDGAEQKTELGEMAFEYVKRLSSRFRLYAGVEGSQDEIEGIFEIQWHFGRHSFAKINNAFGLTSKATDYAPELGIVFVF